MSAIDDVPVSYSAIVLAAWLVRNVDDPMARHAASCLRDLNDRLAALERERDEWRQCCFDLLDAPHYDHFAARMGYGELKAIERMKELRKAERGDGN